MEDLMLSGVSFAISLCLLVVVAVVVVMSSED